MCDESAARVRRIRGACELLAGTARGGSLAALSAHPDELADPRWHRQTSYFERLARDHPEELEAGPEELEAGLARLEHDLAAGTAPRTPGRAPLLVETNVG